MARAYGANASLLAAFETTYGSNPVGDYWKLPFVSTTLGSEQGLIANDLIGLGREPNAPIRDVIKVEGDIVVPVDVRNIGMWLKDALEKAGCTVFFSDIASGAKDNRPGLAQAMDALTEGDTLIVWKLDRLGRSLKHLVHTVESLTHRKIGIRSLSDAGMTTETATGRLMFNMLASLAQFERELIKERTQAGLKSALARGRKGGRKPHLTNEKFQEASRLINVNGLTVRQAAACVRVSKSTLYAALARTRNQQSMRSEDSKPSGA